jgi:hypothetical protein
MDEINNKDNKEKDMVIRENQREIIVGTFDEIDSSLPIEHILDILIQKYGYKIPGKILRDAIQEGILYVDEITDEGVVYLALDDWGETIWRSLHRE